MAGKRISELLRSNPLPTDIIPIGREEGLLTLGVTVGSIQDDFTQQKYKFLNNKETTFSVAPSTNNMTVVLSCGDADSFDIQIDPEENDEYRLGTCVYFTSINESNTRVNCTQGGHLYYKGFSSATDDLALESEFTVKKLITEIQPFQTIKLQFLTPSLWVLGIAAGGTTVVTTGGTTSINTGGVGIVTNVPPGGVTEELPEDLVGLPPIFIDYITDTTIVIETSAIEVDEELNPYLTFVTIEDAEVQLVSINDNTKTIVSNMGQDAYNAF